MQFSNQLTFLNGKFLEMSLEYGIGQVQFAELFVVVDLFLLLLPFDLLGDGTFGVLLLWVVLLDFMEVVDFWALWIFRLEWVHRVNFNFLTILILYYWALYNWQTYTQNFTNYNFILLLNYEIRPKISS